MKLFRRDSEYNSLYVSQKNKFEEFPSLIHGYFAK